MDIRQYHNPMTCEVENGKPHLHLDKNFYLVYTGLIEKIDNEPQELKDIKKYKNLSVDDLVIQTNFK